MRNSTTYILFSLFLSSLVFSCENADSVEKEIESNTQLENSTELSPLEIGQDIAMKTQQILGKNLMNAINSQGSEYAVSFCSTKAISLTDSMAIELNASVKRVSDKNRNPNSGANRAELDYITKAKQSLSNGESPKPQLSVSGDKQIGYYPILMNQMCMQCHGQTSTDISPETLSKINELYPTDRATGYLPNQLRGIWVVEMDDK